MRVVCHVDGRKVAALTSGAVGIGTATPNNTLQVAGGITCTVLTQTSDRNAKENFAPVDAQEPQFTEFEQTMLKPIMKSAFPHLTR